MVDPKQRSLVDIAAEVLADDTQRIGISYTGFCLTALPHKRLPDEQPWEKKGHRVTLLVEPGRLRHNGKAKLYGVPYGARARMILLYLQTQAIRTSSREVALGRSMRDWMERMAFTAAVPRSPCTDCAGTDCSRSSVIARLLGLSEPPRAKRSRNPGAPLPR